MDFVFVFLLLFSINCLAFLLDTITQISPTKDQALTDKHFDILMDLLMEQRRTQRKQDEVISQMSQALLKLQHKVSSYQKQNQSGSVNNRLLECESKTEQFQRELDNLTGKYTRLQMECSELRRNFEIMKVESMLVVQNLTIIDIKSNKLDKEIGMLKKSVSDLRNISDIFDKQTEMN